MPVPLRLSPRARSILALPIAAALSGCVAAGVEAFNIARDRLVYQNNIEAARSGSAEAQFAVGDSLCCSLVENGFYDTEEAMFWLCQSARQEYGPAMQKVGQILSGDVVDGVRVARRVATRISGPSSNPPLAYAWFRAAEAAGVAEAGARASDLFDGMSAEDRAAAVDLGRGPVPAACTLSEAGLA